MHRIELGAWGLNAKTEVVGREARFCQTGERLAAKRSTSEVCYQLNLQPMMLHCHSHDSTQAMDD
jgi:hypothetical protein